MSFCTITDFKPSDFQKMKALWSIGGHHITVVLEGEKQLSVYFVTITEGRREIITIRGQSFQNIDPPPPSPPGECVPPRLCCGGRTHSQGGEGGGGSIFWKTRDIGLASYSNNLSTLRVQQPWEQKQRPPQKHPQEKLPQE